MRNFHTVGQAIFTFGYKNFLSLVVYIAVLEVPPKAPPRSNHNRTGRLKTNTIKLDGQSKSIIIIT